MRQLTALVKPASSACNLKCGYCFYCDEASARSGCGKGFMSIDTARNLIKKVFDFCGSGSVISFMFQGGEPLLAGLRFFEDFVAAAQDLKTDGSTLRFSLQTNGTLIDDGFCEFFKRNDRRQKAAARLPPLRLVRQGDERRLTAEKARGGLQHSLRHHCGHGRK